jgi:hypothetical protein
MPRPSAFTTVVLSLCAVAFLGGCRTVYSDMYSPKRNYFKPVKDKPKPTEFLPEPVPSTPLPTTAPPLEAPPAVPPPADVAPAPLPADPAAPAIPDL